MALENSHGISASTLRDTDVQICTSVCKSIIIENKSDIDKLIYGTYCHPLLIPHIGSWISSGFAVMDSKVVNAYIVGEYKLKLADMETQLQRSKMMELCGILPVTKEFKK